MVKFSELFQLVTRSCLNLRSEVSDELQVSQLTIRILRIFGRPENELLGGSQCFLLSLDRVLV